MRTETTTRTLFTFDELSDSAKEKARDWWRSCEDYDHDFIYEYASQIAALFGLDLNQKPVKLMGGGTRYDPSIFYSGFSSQGDGACFEGRYHYKKGALKAVKAYAPNDKYLHGIVQRLQDIQRKNFYCLGATTKHRGHYCHSGCMAVDVSDNRDNYGNCYDENAESEIKEALRSFADWIYSQLEKEYDYVMSDENVDENIRINEYEFTENGNIA